MIYLKKYKSIIDKTIYNYYTIKELIIFLFVMSIIDLVTTIYAYLTMEGFYEVNIISNYLINTNLILFILVKLLLTIVGCVLIIRGFKGLLKKPIYNFKNIFKIIFYQMIFLMIISFYMLININNLKQIF